MKNFVNNSDQIDVNFDANFHEIDEIIKINESD